MTADDRRPGRCRADRDGVVAEPGSHQPLRVGTQRAQSVVGIDLPHLLRIGTTAASVR